MRGAVHALSAEVPGVEGDGGLGVGGDVEGLDFYWRTRPSSTNELKFEEVRRLSLYNPTSYRKKIKMNLTKNFVVYKVLDEINVIVQTYPNEIEIELSPEGSVIVDFGVFS